MKNDIVSELLSTVKIILQDQVCECPTPTTQIVNGMCCVITRCAEINHDVQLPTDLKQALNQNHIQTRHLPKKFIREYLHVLVEKKSVVIMCEINIQRNNGKVIYENTFEFKINQSI